MEYHEEMKDLFCSFHTWSMSLGARFLNGDWSMSLQSNTPTRFTYRIPFPSSTRPTSMQQEPPASSISPSPKQTIKQTNSSRPLRELIPSSINALPVGGSTLEVPPLYDGFAWEATWDHTTGSSFASSYAATSRSGEEGSPPSNLRGSVVLRSSSLKDLGGLVVGASLVQTNWGETGNVRAATRYGQLQTDTRCSTGEMTVGWAKYVVMLPISSLDRSPIERVTRYLTSYWARAQWGPTSSTSLLLATQWVLPSSQEVTVLLSKDKQSEVDIGVRLRIYPRLDVAWVQPLLGNSSGMSQLFVNRFQVVVRFCGWSLLPNLNTSILCANRRAAVHVGYPIRCRGGGGGYVGITVDTSTKLPKFQLQLMI